jgi:hypothetical protein
MLSDFAGWLQGYFDAALDWLLEGIEWIFIKLFSAVVDGVLLAFDAVSALLPAALSSQPPAVVGGIAWAVEPFLLGEGLALLGGAYLVRFLIRRLPIVG